MVYKANELLAKLRLLVLSGQDIDGSLEWIGNDKEWKGLANEEESILRDWELAHN
jgi:hypothetical protein